MIARWVQLKVMGYAYYEAATRADSLTVGWIRRLAGATRYDVFYCDGKRKVATTRGSAHNSRNFVREMEAS